MRQKFTKWYANKYGDEKGPWWVELLVVFLLSPALYYKILTDLYWTKLDLVRINVFSVMNPDITFDISVPRKYKNKVIRLIPKCGRAWYDYDGFWALGTAEPLCLALMKLHIDYILHEDVSDNPDEEVQFV